VGQLEGFFRCNLDKISIKKPLAIFLL
jgi:hypothetical protein